MRFGLFFNGVFWGVFFVLLGIAIVINIVFKIDIPIFSIFLAFFFVYLGLSIITGGFSFSKMKDKWRTSNYEWNPNDPNSKNYEIAFGQGNIDLTQVTQIQGTAKIRINIAFGQGLVIMNRQYAVKIIADSAFGKTTFPDGSFVSFGTHTYISPGFESAPDRIEIFANLAFGEMTFSGTPNQ